MDKEDQNKATFTTPWGTFMYSKIPFGLMNAWATFQRDMDIDLVGEKDKFVVIYLDDISFSQSQMKKIWSIYNKFLKNVEGMVYH